MTHKKRRQLSLKWLRKITQCTETSITLKELNTDPSHLCEKIRKTINNKISALTDHTKIINLPGIAYVDIIFNQYLIRHSPSCTISTARSWIPKLNIRNYSLSTLLNEIKHHDAIKNNRENNVVSLNKVNVNAFTFDRLSVMVTLRSNIQNIFEKAIQ